MQTNSWLAQGPQERLNTVRWSTEFMEGYITSADTGAEELIRASRAALAQFCEDGYTDIAFNALTQNLKIQVRGEPAPNEDRVVVPCLEVISFLFDAGFLQMMDFEYIPPPNIKFPLASPNRLS